MVIYNPFSTQLDPLNPGKYTRTAFPNNIIPNNVLSPAALLYSQYAFALPNASGLPGGRNLVDTTPSVLDSDSFSGRIDHTFGQRDQVFGRISTYNQPNTYSSSPNIINSTALHGTNFAVQEVHTFGPTSVLTAHFGRNVGVNDILVDFNHAPNNYASALEDAGFSSGYIGGYKGGPQSNVIPLITVSGYLGGSNVNNFQDLQFANTYEYGGDYSKIWGRHNIRVGGILATNDFSMPIASVSESTTSFQTSNLEQPTSPGGAPTGDALASFLLGVPNNAQIRNVNEHEVGGLVNGFYAQDQFLVTRRLTVNYGVRWDVSVWAHQGYLSNGQGYVGTMDLTNGTYLISALPPACSATQAAPCIPGGTLPANVFVSKSSDHSLHYTDFGNWQPRFGFAYHPFGKTAILGGYGRFYDSWNSTTQYAQNSAGTWPSVGLLNNNALNQNIPTATIGNPLNQGTGSVVQPAATPFGNATFYYNPNMKTAYSDQWNLGVEQGLGANTIFNAFYVGSHDGNLDFGALQNTATVPGAGTSAPGARRRLDPYIVPTKMG